MHFIIGMALILPGCATRSGDIAAAYVSSIPELLVRPNYVRRPRASIASGAQDQNATNDAVATGVALVVFWPAAFMLKGNSANTQEVAQLKGDMDEIEQANMRKRCESNLEKPADRQFMRNVDR
jgi:hypothetical protein